ncbi:chemokine (C-X-C motif) ligand 18b [Scomber scombrus]|uniref:Chemokine (C-X-C motif) ligand 18b n=1 Tax=Scomber scombrus TaxID=13677 RepID=A0AAV1PBK1_SCOSC
MALSEKSWALFLVFVAAVCIELYEAHDVPGRCMCHRKIKFIKGNFSDFQVLERRPGCDSIELTVTMSNPDNSTVKICMDTEGKLAKAFLRCWERINKDKSRKMECIDRKRKSETK